MSTWQNMSPLTGATYFIDFSLHRYLAYGAFRVALVLQEPLVASPVRGEIFVENTRLKSSIKDGFYGK